MENNRLKCNIEGCERPRKYAKYGGVCNTHYEQARLGSTPSDLPRLPIQPLRDYAERHNKSVDDLPPDILGDGHVDFHTADEACCKVLGVHPGDIYGDAYWQAAAPVALEAAA
jgi:hypothetical protein